MMFAKKTLISLLNQELCKELPPTQAEFFLIFSSTFRFLLHEYLKLRLQPFREVHRLPAVQRQREV